MNPMNHLRLRGARAARNEERTMLFIPPNKTNRHDRVFKDW